jgi:hypothetical protein
MLGTAQGPVGGVRIVGRDPLADNVGAGWLTYVGVPDIKAALAAVEARGGRVLHAVTEVPGNGGRYAVIADPQAAAIGLYQPGGAMADQAGTAPSGPDSWHELTTGNPEAALQFYNAIFGWDVVARHDMGGQVGMYYVFGKGAKQMGGVYLRGKDLPPSWSKWLVYMGVPGVVAAAEAVKAAGGTVLNGPHEVPGGSWITQITDSHGVPLALNGPKEAAVTAKKAPAKPKAKATAKPAAPPKAKVKTKVKAKPKAKVKAKAKAKTKPKPKRKSAPKAKVAARGKRKVAVKSKAKAKPKAKRAKAGKKAARRGK